MPSKPPDNVVTLPVLESICKINDSSTPLSSVAKIKSPVTKRSLSKRNCGLRLATRVVTINELRSTFRIPRSSATYAKSYLESVLIETGLMNPLAPENGGELVIFVLVSS